MKKTTRQITDKFEISQDLPFDANLKPPNEVWVEVLDGSAFIEAMAFYGRDGYLPHWKLRDGTCCHPSRFSKWRFSLK